MKFTICDLRFTSQRQTAHLNRRSRRKESLISFQFETRHPVSCKTK
jgi:hypothetical protein